MKAFYGDRLILFKTNRELVLKASMRVALARAAVFISMLILVFTFFKTAPLLGIAVPIILLGIFFYLVGYSLKLNLRLRFLDQLIRVQTDEIRSMDFDFSVFPEGMEFMDYHHPYSYDLDIFGKHSIYRMLNRTGTDRGHHLLADELLNPEIEPEIIRRRQDAVKELTPNIELRHRFLANARMVDETDRHAGLIQNWLKAPDRYRQNGLMKVLIRVIPVFSFLLPVGFIFLSSTVHLPYTLFLYYLLPLGIVLFESKVITREHNRVSQLLKLFRKYQELLEIIEKEEFQSTHLNDLKKRLISEGEKASEITKDLAKIVWGLEARMNLIMAFILNALVLWDIRFMFRLEKWRYRYGDEFEKWLEVIGRFEVLCSLANIAFNRKDMNWPEIESGDFKLEIRQGGHPLINPSKRVDNDLLINGKSQIFLITGANMAGKSTLLRMAGVNFILAMLGAPVCADEMHCTPALIRTSVRTNDSLGDDESYFYAELKKLSNIIGELEEGKALFVIVDEMLRGTNSRDKHAGSEALIRKFIRLKASGLVATHDVELGKLTDQYPAQIHTHCFEVTLIENQLHFDYLLRPGISKSLNATFLMRQMGIIDNE